MADDDEKKAKDDPDGRSVEQLLAGISTTLLEIKDILVVSDVTGRAKELQTDQNGDCPDEEVPE